MALRFRRSFRLAPGVRMNLSGSGVSWSVGPRGASVSFGSRGTFLNAGIPGTGLYSREKIGGSQARPERVAPGKITVSATVRLEDDGTVKFLDADGAPLSSEWIERAKRQRGDQIREFIQKHCDEINEQIEQLGKLYLHTPKPHERIKYSARNFDVPVPKDPTPKGHGFLGWLFKSVRTRIDLENADGLSAYRKQLTEWQRKKASFDIEEQVRKNLLEVRVFNDVDAMEIILEGALTGITWPRETSVSAQIDEGGRLALLDVDLPEIEDMPKRTANLPGRGYKATMKVLSDTQARRLYMAHIHAIGFRIVGEVFAVLPKVSEIVLSAFSQRPNKATGTIENQYLYSVRVKRKAWGTISFDNLIALDVVTALERFELRREMTTTGVFRAVEPLSSSGNLTS